MMIRLILALALLILLFWYYKRWRALPPEVRNQTLLKYMIIIAFIVCIAAVVTGRLHWLGAVVAGIAALIKFGLHTMLRAAPFLNILRKSPFFSNPTFKTPFLEASIDLKTGQIVGSVLQGPHEGKPLAHLSSEDLQELESHYLERDRASLYLIRVIRQRTGHQYQQKQQYQSTHDPSINEALQILGLDKNPNRQNIIKAHRSLIQKLHPDRGGNDYLASRINLAKEILLKHID